MLGRGGETASAIFRKKKGDREMRERRRERLRETQRIRERKKGKTRKKKKKERRKGKKEEGKGGMVGDGRRSPAAAGVGRSWPEKAAKAPSPSKLWGASVVHLAKMEF